MMRNLLAKFFNWLYPTGTVHAHGRPDLADTKIIVIPCEPAFESTPTWVEIPLLCCPDNAGYQMELLAVTWFAHTLPADAGGVVGDLEWVDDSASDAVANLKAAFDFTAGTARVANEVWRGSQILDPGDTVNFEMATDGSLSTPAVGAALVVEFRLKERMSA